MVRVAVLNIYGEQRPSTREELAGAAAWARRVADGDMAAEREVLGALGILPMLMECGHPTTSRQPFAPQGGVAGRPCLDCRREKKAR